MNLQNVQPVQQAAQNVQPSMPVATDPGFMNTDPADIDFIINEDTGAFEIVAKSAPVEQPSVSEDLRFQAATEEAATQRITESNPLEAKLAQMESAMLQMGQVMQNLLQQQNLNNLRTPQQEVEEEPVDFSDPQSLVTLINKAVESAIKSKLDPHLGTMDEVKMRMDYNNAAYKFGQKFIELTPAMAEIKKSDPNIPWETIYQAMDKAMSLGKSTSSDSTIQTGNGSSNGARQPQPAQALVNKANALQTESGQPRSIVNEAPKVRTVEDAFNKAFADLLG